MTARSVDPTLRVAPTTAGSDVPPDGALDRPAGAVGPRWLRPLLAIDAVGSGIIGLGLVGLAGPLHGPVGLASATPLVLLGVLFLGNVLVNARAARRPALVTLRPPVVVDLAFGAGMLALASLDPVGLALWARWAAVAIGVVSIDLAVAKAIGWRALRDVAGRA
ncbi:MAG: hypothetical protein JJT89_02655 [Nitriliruptoraceae bacterium]|nr:hypothetical protein [Nitriliruptoraceae bacterium]